VGVERQEGIALADTVEVNGSTARVAYGMMNPATPFIYARYLAAFGAVSFAYDQGWVTIRKNSSLATARVSEHRVLDRGQRTTYDLAPINIRGRVYLPLSMFRDIADADIIYDPATRRICIRGVERAAFHAR
jgi:hypothetical protein